MHIWPDSLTENRRATSAAAKQRRLVPLHVVQLETFKLAKSGPDEIHMPTSNRAMSSDLAVHRTERGATAVEYALIAGLISVAIITSVVFLQSKSRRTFTKTASAIGLGGLSQTQNLSLGQPLNVFSTKNAGDTVGTWSINSGSVDVIGNNYWNSPAGDGAIDLNGSSVGAISQTFSTVPGEPYTLSYYLAGNVDAPGNATSPIKTLTVTVGPEQRTESFDVTGKTSTNMGWVLKTISFIADSNTTTAVFQSTSTAAPFQGPAISGLSLELG